MIKNFKNQKLNIFITDIDIYLNNNIKQLFIDSNITVYSNFIYYEKNVNIIQKLPNNVNFDIIITNCNYMINKLNEYKVIYKYLITVDFILNNIQYIDNINNLYLYKINISTNIIKNCKANIFYNTKINIPQNNNIIPIIIRTRNRHLYLNTTLNSINNTILNNFPIYIIDDKSDTKITNEYLFSNNQIKINNFSWNKELNTKICDNKNNQELWNKYIGKINIPEKIYGIKNKYPIIQPQLQTGDKCGLLWIINFAFNYFKFSNNIIILEDDLIFNKNWLNITLQILQSINYNTLGCISVYNRDETIIDLNKLFLEKKQIGGVMYLIPRHIYNSLNKNNIFNQNINEFELAGDTYFLNYLNKYNYKIYNSHNSYIQHIGINSICRPRKIFTIFKKFYKK